MLITHLKAKVELHRQPHLEGKPVLITSRGKGRTSVVDTSPATSPVHAGMTLEQALSHYSNAIVLESDELTYQRVFRQVLTSLQEISDRVEGSELGIAYVRLDGLEGVYDGEARLASTLLHAVPDYLSPRVSLAEAKFPAYVAALTSNPFGAFKVPDDTVAFLAPHSVNLLPVSPEMKEAMHRFGLHTMGDVGSVKEELLVDQFGPSGRKVWKLCHGIDECPLVPLRYEESVVEHTSLPFFSTSMPLIATGVETLLRRAYSRPQMRGRYAGRMDLLCTLFRSHPWEKVIHFKEPVGKWERAAYIIRSKMETDHPQAPVEEITLTLANLTGESGTQMGLLPDIKADRERRLAEVEKRLQARMKGQHAGPAHCSDISSLLAGGYPRGAAHPHYRRSRGGESPVDSGCVRLGPLSLKRQS